MPRDVIAPVDEIGKVLLRAADLLETGGWCQFVLQYGSAHCAMGALERAGDYRPSLCQPAYERIATLVGDGGIVRWNDADGRTKEDVIALFRAAAGRPWEIG